MLQSLKILYKATPREVEHHLPVSLNRIKDIATNCTNQAEAVVDEYERVINTLHELQVASLTKQVLLIMENTSINLLWQMWHDFFISGRYWV